MTRYWRVARNLLAILNLTLVLAPNSAQAEAAQPPFPAFQQVLEQTLKAKGFDPQHQTFHFVILMDNVRSADPVGQEMDAIANGLLDHYLVTTSEASDEVSFVTFQLDVLQNHTQYNLPFSSDNAQSVKQLIPLGPAPEGTHQGGNDKEKALLLALKMVSDPQKAIYIVLGDTEKSQTPLNEPNYQLARDSDDFKQVAGKYGMVAWSPMSLTPDGPNAQPIYFRLYLPTGLTPLGGLTKSARNEILTPSVASSAVNPVTLSPPSATVSSVESAPKPESPSGGIVGGVLTAILFAGALFYFLWLRAPRNVQIGPVHDGVRFGTPMFVVAQEDQLILTSKPGGSRIARLEVGWNGDVIMSGESFYTLPKTKVVLTNTRKTYWLKDNRTGDETHEIIAHRIR
jgi:hypothetical protein